MSLAEPRKRRKNPMHSINLSAPNHWTNDDSKFGQRMLEKFGWTKGSGLGKNKQGISENIRVQHKVNPTGLGFIAHNADDWFKAGEDYSRLLSQLTEKFDQYQALTKETDDSIPKKSLVQNSLNSKSRVHYHKFTKGKDLTQYKREELTCILGKGLKDDQNLSGLNMKEYFKNKRESKQIKSDELDTTSNDNSTIIVDDEINGKMDVKSNTETKINNTHIKQKKLSKETEIVLSNECNNTIELKKKKKSKILPVDDIDLSTVKDKLNELSSNNEKQLEKKKKKSKVIPIEDVDSSILKGKYEMSSKDEKLPGKKKKKSEILPIEDVDQSLIRDKLNEMSSNNDEEPEKKKKKSKTLANKNVEQSKKTEKQIKSCTDENDLDCYNSEHNSNDLITDAEQSSDLVLTHKYQNLVDLLIENSSAGKKFCKDLPNCLFEKKMKEFADSVKRQYATKVDSTEVKCTEKLISNKPKTLDPDDKNFVQDFEAQKSKTLEIISKRQEMAKYINEKSMFMAQHGDILFFGSNLNDIKGYGDW